MASKTVKVKSAALSKINGISALAAAATAFVMNVPNLSADTRAWAVATIALLSSAAIIIMRTWFTTSITPSSANNL